MTDTAVLAHGLGGSSDLPIPYTYALIGAAWALTLTFAVVAIAWRTPRFDPAKPGSALPVWVTRVVDARAFRAAAAALASAFAVWVVVVAVVGPQDDENALPGVFYVLLWVGLVAVSVVVGPVWRLISPLRTLLRALPDRWSAGARLYPEEWGYRPAALGLFAFVWLELASPDPGSLTAIKVWLLAYVVLMLAGAATWGPRWFARADPFEVYSMTASRLAPFRRRDDGRIVLGNPFDHLPTLPVRPGTVTVLAVLLGSTAFDSFSAMPGWRGFVDDLSGGQVGATVIRTLGLMVFIATVGLSFWLAARATGGVDAARRRLLPGQLAHSLIPIVIGYIFAHYLSYLVERGQQTLIRLVQPLGWEWEVSYLLSQHPSVLATIKVVCVVFGHMAGVVAAHDAALRLLPERHRLTGQLAMMLVMVFYTFTGLYLLFGG
ncbi:MAG: hypothetical protein ABWY45_22045 [Mycobacterium sp.]